MTRGLFVTGTDTGVGKTVVAGAVAAALTRRGARVAAFKPVVTGLEASRCRRFRVPSSGLPGVDLAAAGEALLAGLTGTHPTRDNRPPCRPPRERPTCTSAPC